MKSSQAYLSSTFSSLRYRDFRLLLFSSVFASAAQWMQQITVGWLIYQLTESPFLLGLAMSLKVLPALFAGPLTGVAADRLDRRRLLIGTEAYLTVLAASFAATVALGWIDVWQILVFMFLSGVGNAMNNVVRQSLIPNLVPRRELMNAIALHSSLFSTSRIVGPAVGGVLIATLGPASSFFLQSGLYFVFLLMLLPLRVAQSNDSKAGASITSDLTEGIRHAFARKEITYQLFMSVVAQLVIMPYSTMLPAYAEEVIHTGPEGLGLLYGAVGVGAVVATLGLASLGDFPHLRRLLVGSGLVISASLTLFGLSAAMSTSLLALLMVGAGHMAFNSTNNTMLQKNLPDQFRGRVTAIKQASNSLQVPGALAIGGLAEIFGVGTVIVGVGLAAAGVIVGLNVIYGKHIGKSPDKETQAATQVGGPDM